MAWGRDRVYTECYFKILHRCDILKSRSTVRCRSLPKTDAKPAPPTYCPYAHAQLAIGVLCSHSIEGHSGCIVSINRDFLHIDSSRLPTAWRLPLFIVQCVVQTDYLR